MLLLWNKQTKIVEEHISSENVYLHSAVDHWSWWIFRYLPSNKQASLNKPTSKVIQLKVIKINVIKEVVSPEVQCNEQKARSKMHFSLEKRLDKRKLIHPTHDSTSRWIVL